MPRRSFSQISREQPITWAVIEWLQAEDWPHVFQEADIRRGLGHGRADLGAASAHFARSAAVEVKAAHVPESEVVQLFDACRAAEFVYFAAPLEVIEKVDAPKKVGLLEAGPAVPPARPRIKVLRPASKGEPDWEMRKDFLHALMRAASRRGRFDTSITAGKNCPACQSASCPFWRRPSPDLDLEIEEL